MSSRCITPFQLSDDNGGHIVPCGKCPRCLARRTSWWSFRLMQEYKRSKSADFITLTYDTTYVPITANGFLMLGKGDLQRFWKRLRKAHGNTDLAIKYYAVGEYGAKRQRPHYHAILFNADREYVGKSWQRGDVYYGSVTEASVGYVLKYLNKDLRVTGKHKRDDRVKEFSVMSKRLGDNYLTPAMVEWHKADLLERMYCNLEEGKKISMPRFYRLRLYSDLERESIVNHVVKSHELEELEKFEKLGWDGYKRFKDNEKEAVLRKFDYQNSISKR